MKESNVRILQLVTCLIWEPLNQLEHHTMMKLSLVILILKFVPPFTLTMHLEFIFKTQERSDKLASNQ